MKVEIRIGNFQCEKMLIRLVNPNYCLIFAKEVINKTAKNQPLSKFLRF